MKLWMERNATEPGRPTAPRIDFMKLDFGRKLCGQILSLKFWTNFYPKTQDKRAYTYVLILDHGYMALKRPRKPIFMLFLKLFHKIDCMSGCHRIKLYTNVSTK
jgi:hypothetical protein